MPEVEMTLGPGAAMEEAVFGEGSGRGGSQGRGQQGAATIGNLNPVTLSKSDLTELEDLSNRGSRGVVAPAESETWMRAAPPRLEGSRRASRISAAESSAVEAAERLAAQIAASSEEESDAGEDEGGRAGLSEDAGGVRRGALGRGGGSHLVRRFLQGRRRFAAE